MSDGPILIMAGGTGGHVFPAMAVAQALLAREVEVVWLGTRRGLEARLVPPAGIPIEWINIGGLRGKGLTTVLVAPVALIRALWQSVCVLRRLQPSAVLGMGGFVSGPGGLAAWLLRRPLIIHEQNTVPGMTNRLLARVARVVLEAFPGSFDAAAGARHVGNPVRREISALAPPDIRLARRDGPARLLVLGGSQGALRLNQVVPEALFRLPLRVRPEVWHQAGPGTLNAAEQAYRAAEIEARLDAFIDDMAAAYAWADLVVCRAGALTVSELANVGLGAVFVPFPAAVDDHQTRNAGHLVGVGAAVLVPEPELTAERLARELGQLLGNRARLLDMARAARAQAMPDAAEQVAETCLRAARAQAERAAA
ncbi:MAG: undecaprenyldiphospho-muramoylpentapeptide beta-N-acetylglucosaminyltransferase [Gammaproteobacteria bacterium]